jgi:TonB family protein
VSAAARLAAALALSLMLHGALLATMDRLPSGGRLGLAASGNPWSAQLFATLRQAPPGASLVPTDLQMVSPFVARTDTAAAAGDRPDRPAPQPASGLVASPRYLPASELDEKPQIRTRPELEFPAGARANSGRVVLRLYIGDSGSVDEIAVLSAEPEPAFEEPAVRAFAGALFTPGRIRGVPVRSSVTMEVLFGAVLPLDAARLPDGPLFQPPRGRAAPRPPRKESP